MPDDVAAALAAWVSENADWIAREILARPAPAPGVIELQAYFDNYGGKNGTSE